MAADLPSCEVDLARDHSVLLVSWEPTGAMAWCPPISTWLWQLPRARRATGATQSASSCRSLATPPSAPQSLWGQKARHPLGPADPGLMPCPGTAPMFCLPAGAAAGAELFWRRRSYRQPRRGDPPGPARRPPACLKPRRQLHSPCHASTALAAAFALLPLLSRRRAPSPAAPAPAACSGCRPEQLCWPAAGQRKASWSSE
jgi:hypothetical protein